MAKKNESYLKFNFDVSAYRLLGRELITDRITALFELVKNCYDANSNKVTIKFIDINPINENSKIIISDDGLGMDFSDVKNKWMVIGTSSKRKNKTSPSPYNRVVAGKKGVGRFAVDKLGSKLILKTKKKGTNTLFCLETDWVNYSKIENQQLSLEIDSKKDFFTDIRNRYWLENADKELQGTILEISRIENDWTENDIARAYKELSKLISPNNDVKKYPFQITLETQYPNYKNTPVTSQLIDFATLQLDLSYNLKKGTQEILQYKNGELTKIKSHIRACGPINLNLYYFNQQAKAKYKNHFNTEIDGIKIYRDGIITTPFAEYIANQDEQKDILGIDKRRYSGFFDKLSTRDLLGYVEITEKHNQQIIESTNRQGFVDNEAWSELKKFIIEQLQQLENYLKNEKKQSREKTQSGLKAASVTIKDLKSDIAKIKHTVDPELKNVLNNIENNLGKLQGTVTKGVNDYIKLEEETKQRESLLFSLVSLQTFAAMFSHMTKHTIGHIITSAEYFSNNYPNQKLESRFIKISKRIYSEMLKLRKGVDFMLKYAKSDSDIEDISMNELIENLFYNIYEDIFKREKIRAEIILGKDIILKYNRKAIEDVFDNLISNSIKALQNKTDKKIKCSTIANKKEFIINFSDNGIGIKESDKHRIFDVFFTTTAEDGGAGMGLFMVKSRIEAMKGEIEVVENELKPTGATFKIVLPFKK
jgi:signal transduction histidine kinase